MPRPPRPRSSSAALSASFSGEPLDGRQLYGSDLPRGDSHDGQLYGSDRPRGDSAGDQGQLRVPALISPPCSVEDVDLSPPELGMASLDFDPMSFQCSLPASAAAPPSPASREGASPEPSAPLPERPDGPKLSLTPQNPSPISVTKASLSAPSPNTLQGSSVSRLQSTPQPSVGAAPVHVSESDGAPPTSVPPAPPSRHICMVSNPPLSGTFQPQGEYLCAAAMEISITPVSDISEPATNHPGQQQHRTAHGVYLLLAAIVKFSLTIFW